MTSVLNRVTTVRFARSKNEVEKAAKEIHMPSTSTIAHVSNGSRKPPPANDLTTEPKAKGRMCL